MHNISSVGSTPIFKAAYPHDFPTNSRFRIPQFIHKKVGEYILNAQSNPYGFTQAQRAQACENLKTRGGKVVQFKTADDVTVNGMHFIGKGCVEHSPTLILFNGRAGRYELYGHQFLDSIRRNTVKNWLKLGVNVLIFNYRGIDNNHGSATCDGVVLDGDAALQYVHKVLNVPINKIILHGHSLGGGIASAVGALHPKVNYCNDRSFSSLAHQVKMMLGEGIKGTVAAKIFAGMGWEYNTLENWTKIEGHKWIIHHPNDSTIVGRLINRIKEVDSKAITLSMLPQWFETKKGMRPEDISLLDRKPTPGDISYAHTSTHQRKLCGEHEKALYAEQVRLAVG